MKDKKSNNQTITPCRFYFNSISVSKNSLYQNRINELLLQVLQPQKTIFIKNVVNAANSHKGIIFINR